MSNEDKVALHVGQQAIRIIVLEARVESLEAQVEVLLKERVTKDGRDGQVSQP